MIGAFNPFTFKVIINMYDLITIFLIVLGLFSVGRTFPSLVFCLEKFFSICCKAGLVVQNSLNFAYLEPFDFSIKSEGESCWVDSSWL